MSTTVLCKFLFKFTRQFHNSQWRSFVHPSWLLACSTLRRGNANSDRHTNFIIKAFVLVAGQSFYRITILSKAGEAFFKIGCVLLASDTFGNRIHNLRYFHPGIHGIIDWSYASEYYTEQMCNCILTQFTYIVRRSILGLDIFETLF